MPEIPELIATRDENSLAALSWVNVRSILEAQQWKKTSMGVSGPMELACQHCRKPRYEPCWDAWQGG